jgi:hypothetical protein
MPGRIIYAVTIAGISIVCSIVLLPPFRHTFYAFPLDIILFVLWMVAFGLLGNVSQFDPHYTEALSVVTKLSECIKADMKNSVLAVPALPSGTRTIGVITGAGFGPCTLQA